MESLQLEGQFSVGSGANQSSTPIIGKLNGKRN